MQISTPYFLKPQKNKNLSIVQIFDLHFWLKAGKTLLLKSLEPSSILVA